MPRTKLGELKYKDKDLTELIRRYKYGKALSNAGIAKKVGISERSWNNYMADPGRMPLRILRSLQKVLQIPKDEMLPFLV